MAAPITDGWLVEVNNFSLILPGLFGDQAEQTKVPMIFDTASICFLIRISLADLASQSKAGLTLGKSRISVTCVNKFNLNENILSLHSAVHPAQGLASVVTMNSKRAPSDRAR